MHCSNFRFLLCGGKFIWSLFNLVKPLSNFLFDRPPNNRIYVPLSFAFLFAEINSLGLVSVYIPSTIRTTLKFRYGSIGSLHDDEFQKMRTQSKFACQSFTTLWVNRKVTLAVVTILCHVSGTSFLHLWFDVLGLFLIKVSSFTENHISFLNWILYLYTFLSWFFVASLFCSFPSLSSPYSACHLSFQTFSSSYPR